MDSETDTVQPVCGLTSSSNRSIIKPPEKYKPTLEITFLCIFFADAVNGLVINNLLINRACNITFGYNETICLQLQSPDKPESLETLEEQVQSYVTLVTMVKSVLEGIFPAILSFFIGVWSDKYGRKPLIVWPLLGQVLASYMLCVYTLYSNLDPWWFILTAVPISLTGGMSALFTGTFCYITDITRVEDRSYRLAFLEASIYIGLLIGSISSRYAYTRLSYTNIILITSIFTTIGYLYTLLLLKESIMNTQKATVKSIFNITFVNDMFKTCFKTRSNYDRAIIFLLLTANSISIFVLYGCMNIDYLYTRLELLWQIDNYSIYAAYGTITNVLGLVVGTLVLQRLFKMSDYLLIDVSYLSSILQHVIMAFVKSSWLIYFGSTISFLRGNSSAIIRSKLSKIVPKADISKVFALMASLEAVLPVFAPLPFSIMYRETLNFFPGAVFLLNSGFFLICLGMILVAHLLSRRYPTQPYVNFIDEHENTHTTEPVT